MHLVAFVVLELPLSLELLAEQKCLHRFADGREQVGGFGVQYDYQSRSIQA